MESEKNTKHLSRQINNNNNTEYLLQMCLDLDNTIINPHWDHKHSIEQLADYAKNLKINYNVKTEISFISGRDVPFIYDFTLESNEIFEKKGLKNSFKYICGENGNIFTNFKPEEKLSLELSKVIFENGDIKDQSSDSKEFIKKFTEIINNSEYKDVLVSDGGERVYSYVGIINDSLKKRLFEEGGFYKVDKYMEDMKNYIHKTLKEKGFQKSLVTLYDDCIEILPGDFSKDRALKSILKQLTKDVQIHNSLMNINNDKPQKIIGIVAAGDSENDLAICKNIMELKGTYPIAKFFLPHCVKECLKNIDDISVVKNKSNQENFLEGIVVRMQETLTPIIERERFNEINKIKYKARDIRKESIRNNILDKYTKLNITKDSKPKINKEAVV